MLILWIARQWIPKWIANAPEVFYIKLHERKHQYYSEGPTSHCFLFTLPLVITGFLPLPVYVYEYIYIWPGWLWRQCAICIWWIWISYCVIIQPFSSLMSVVLIFTTPLQMDEYWFFSLRWIRNDNGSCDQIAQSLLLKSVLFKSPLNTISLTIIFCMYLSKL